MLRFISAEKWVPRKNRGASLRVIPYGRQSINDEDINAVLNVLSSDFLTQGPVVPNFEQDVCKYCDANYAVAVNSATSALHIACLALGVGRGDLVWTSPISFVASSNCALYCGAHIDFIDIDLDTLNISPTALEDKLCKANALGRLPKVLIVVHLGGQSCEMERIFLLSKKYGFSIIEDASHAIGGSYKSEAIGSCKYSDITVFSFHPVKIITTAEGGMATTNDEGLANAMRLLRSHGISMDLSVHNSLDADGVRFYEQRLLGFNYRMTDIQAALGRSQIKRIDKFIGERRSIAAYYDQCFSSLPISPQQQLRDSKSSYHLYILRFQKLENSFEQKKLFEYMKTNGVNVNLHYIPIYRQPFYEQMGFKSGYCPEAEKYWRSAMTIPLYPGLSKQDQDKIINLIKQASML